MKHYAFVLGILALIVSPAMGWHVNTHLQMTRDAVALIPPEYQEMFTQHQKFVEAGIKDPDEMLKDWSNHYYIPATNEGNAIARIERIINVIQAKFKSGTPMDTSKQLCYLAHYIGDLWSPEAILKGSTTPDMDFINNNDIVVLFEGYEKPIENPPDYFRKRVEWRWRLENSKEISTLLYSEAVNDIVRIWLTLWQNAGKPTQTYGSSVIFHKKGALNINFERLLLEEKVYWYSFRDGFISSGSVIDAYQAHTSEVDRLESITNPSEEQLAASAMARNEQEWMNRLNPSAPFQMLESSMKTIENKAYFVARVRNQGETDIPSIAFMYPGIKGPVALVKVLKPSQVAKVEAVLPANAAKDQIQLIFSSVTEQ